MLHWQLGRPCLAGMVMKDTLGRCLLGMEPCCLALVAGESMVYVDAKPSGGHNMLWSGNRKSMLVTLLK